MSKTKEKEETYIRREDKRIKKENREEIQKGKTKI